MRMAPRSSGAPLPSRRRQPPHRMTPLAVRVQVPLRKNGIEYLKG